MSKPYETTVIRQKQHDIFVIQDVLQIEAFDAIKSRK